MAGPFGIINTATTMAGGVSALAGQGQQWQLLVQGTWIDGDIYTVDLTDTTTGIVTQIGGGFVTGVNFDFVTTFNNKIYGLAGASVYFSGVAQPTTWNDPNGSFNGFVSIPNYYATAENLVAMAPYQGRLAFFSRWTIQIFIIDANPANWQQAQVMPNMGTFAPLSVQSLGDLDVLFLSDTGVRSLRVRDSSLYAFINDIGTPIDALIQASLIGGSATSNAAACGIVEPSTGRYWLALNGAIYVLSYYPSAKITAWSEYLPSYVSTLSPGTTETFTAQQFLIFQGQVYCLATSTEGNVLLQYGGVNNNSYDTCVVTAATTWLDLKAPVVQKTAKALDVAVNTGLTTSVDWNVSVGTDQLNETLNLVYEGASATFELGQVPVTGDGYHFKIQAVSSGTGPATINSMIYHYIEGKEK